MSTADRMKTIAYTCPYVPAEWIAAHGLRARRLVPLPIEGTSTIPRIEGLCLYARAFVNDVAASDDVSGVVVTTMCDPMRRVFDLLVRRVDTPAFLLNVPSTWQTVAAQRLYLDELKRLGRFLVRLGGHEPDKEELIRAMLDQAHGNGVHGTGFPNAMNRVGGPTPYGHGVPLALVGGPLMLRDRVLFDVIADCGGRIVLDATETGQRGVCGPFDRRRLAEDPLMELAQAYFRLPDASRRPNSELYRWLKDQLAQSGAHGIIFHHYVWCDKWRAEFARLKEWANLPVLRLDSEGDGPIDMVRTRNRVRAFMEMFQ
ncbi:MAG: 2-hydroxyacyl-CoA dehydratase family protein [Phycisphaerae bacterium]|nr:2-hydroxyacyl-CoA dehydratase family protein [Phycisphaerae bacterium]